MATSVVGIDIGESDIKIVRLTPASRRTIVSGFAVAEVSGGTDFKRLAAQARVLIDANGLDADTYALAIPAHLSFLRRFSFPFSSTSKIDQILAYEIEQHLPYPLEKVVIAYRKASQRKDGTQAIIAAALPKDTLTRLLEAFHEEGLPVSEVGLSVDVLDFIVKKVDVVLPSQSIWLDIGYERIQFMYFVDNMSTCYRSFLWTCPEQTVAWREINATGTCQEYSNHAACLGREIITTILATNPAENRMPQLVVVCGEGANNDRLLAALGDQFQGTVRRLEDFPWKGFDMESEIRRQRNRLAIALGLALRGLESSERLDFLQGEFAVKSARIARSLPLYVLAAAFSLTLICLGLLIGFNLRFKAKQVEALDSQMHQIVKTIIPDVGTGLSVKQYIGIIKERIKRLEEKKIVGGQQASESSLIETLRMFSLVVLNKGKIVLRSLSLDEGRVRVKAEADTFETVESLKKELITFDIFQDIQIKDIKAKAGAWKAEFNLELVRKK